MTKQSAKLWNLLIAAISCFSFNVFSQDADLGANANVYTPTARYPLQNIDRPGVVPVGIIKFDTGATFSGLKTVGVDIGTQFGIIDDLDGRISYDGFEFNNFKVKRTLNLGARYKYFGMPHISASFNVNVPVHILNDEIVKNIVLGLPITFYNEVMAGGLFSDLLDLTMRPNVAAKLDFKFWYGYQFNKNIWAEISSSFGHITLDNNQNEALVKKAIFWQELPLTLTGIYAFSNAFDLGASFGFSDVMKGAEKMNMGLTLSYRAGRLFS